MGEAKDTRGAQESVLTKAMAVIGLMQFKGEMEVHRDPPGSLFRATQRGSLSVDAPVREKIRDRTPTRGGKRVRATTLAHEAWALQAAVAHRSEGRQFRRLREDFFIAVIAGRSGRSCS
jgi:hypothetical protein